MKRLTFKVNDSYYVNEPKHLYDDVQELVQKLGKFEDLEEQLGCPIEVVLEALENGVYVEDYDGELLPILRDWHNCTKNTGAFGFLDKRVFNKYAFYKWKDYKKTWWTKEDKSE